MAGQSEVGHRRRSRRPVAGKGPWARERDVERAAADCVPGLVRRGRGRQERGVVSQCPRARRDQLLHGLPDVTGHLDRNAEPAGQVAGAAVRDGAAQVLAARELHDHERPALLLATYTLMTLSRSREVHITSRNAG